jgi:hypothetical protein
MISPAFVFEIRKGNWSLQSHQAAEIGDACVKQSTDSVKSRTHRSQSTGCRFDFLPRPPYLAFPRGTLLQSHRVGRVAFSILFGPTGRFRGRRAGSRSPRWCAKSATKKAPVGSSETTRQRRGKRCSGQHFAKSSRQLWGWRCVALCHLWVTDGPQRQLSQVRKLSWYERLLLIATNRPKPRVDLQPVWMYASPCYHHSRVTPVRA